MKFCVRNSLVTGPKIRVLDDTADYSATSEFPQHVFLLAVIDYERVAAARRTQHTCDRSSVLPATGSKQIL